MTESGASDLPVLVTSPKNAPGPRGDLLFGSMRDIQKDPLGFIVSARRDYGPIFRCRLLFYPCYFIASPSGVRRVLQANARNYTKESADYVLLREVLGRSVGTSDGEYWRRERRIVQPVFHRQQVAAFGEIITDETVMLLARWQRSAEEDAAIDVAAEMTHITLDVVAKALFSTDITADAPLIARNCA